MSVAITPLFLELHHVFVVDNLEVAPRHQITFVFCEPALDERAPGGGGGAGGTVRIVE